MKRGEAKGMDGERGGGRDQNAAFCRLYISWDGSSFPSLLLHSSVPVGGLAFVIGMLVRHQIF